MWWFDEQDLELKHGLKYIIEEIRRIKMSIDALNNSIKTLGADVDKLLALEAGSVPQAQVDAAQAAVDAIDAKVAAVVNPPVAPAPPATPAA